MKFTNFKISRECIFPIGYVVVVDGKPDSLFPFNSYKRKRNPVTKVQELVPEMSHISPQTYKILPKNAEKHLFV